MISGDKPKEVKRFLFIDRMADGSDWVAPKDGEIFWGIPYGYHTRVSEAFIEHYVGGKLVKTINAADLAIVEFK